MNATFEIQERDGKRFLIPGTCNCKRCMGTPGKVYSGKMIQCTKCNGTGKRGRGKCRECNTYNAKPGFVPDYADRVTCPECNGQYEGAGKATLTDYMPDGIFQSLPFKVFRTNNLQTWNEAYLGFGCIFSVTDYGRSKDQNDEELIESVRKERVQAFNIANHETGELCKFIAIICNSGGYTVRAVWENEQGKEVVNMS